MTAERAFKTLIYASLGFCVLGFNVGLWIDDAIGLKCIWTSISMLAAFVSLAHVHSAFTNKEDTDDRQ